MEELQKINIIYEDNHILVVEKPANIPVCEDNSHDLDLLTMLKRYIKDKYNKPGNVYLGLVHRLDRPVGGIMVFAKTSKASSRLSRQIQEHKMDKIYYAVVNGKINSDGEMVDYLYKDKINNMSYATDKNKGKEARLKYKRIGYNKDNDYSLVEVFLYTGRSHQIRVQFASRGYSLVGDQKYGETKTSFIHPLYLLH